MDQSIRELNERIQKESVFVREMRNELRRVVVGQDQVVERILVGLLGDGHILLEGVPGLAKTLMVKSVAACIQAKFQRIQFTPDLLPADLIGTLVLNPQTMAFTVRKGPIFANLVLADEINRSPAKTQSALLEAMQERQVTIGEETFRLDDPFLVLATQNPIEQEGTYPLPEAQVDRFMLKVQVTYPDRAEERRIVDLMTAAGSTPQVRAVVTPRDIIAARHTAASIYIDEKLVEYVLSIVGATRRPGEFHLSDLAPLIRYGASPRASIHLVSAAKCLAFLNGRGYVTPDDIKSLACDVLRHRIILSYEAEAQEMTTDRIIRRILDTIEVP
jgi:MoxR-like ATPase